MNETRLTYSGIPGFTRFFPISTRRAGAGLAALKLITDIILKGTVLSSIIIAGSSEPERINHSEDIGAIEEMSAARAEAFRQGDAETITSTAKYLNILQRHPDGTWLTTHDIWNDNE